jgi:hypothetical protein
MSSAFTRTSFRVSSRAFTHLPRATHRPKDKHAQGGHSAAQSQRRPRVLHRHKHVQGCNSTPRPSLRVSTGAPTYGCRRRRSRAAADSAVMNSPTSTSRRRPWGPSADDSR